jgi:hypothetical protein
MQGLREKLEYPKDGKRIIRNNVYSLFAYAIFLKELNTLNSFWLQGNQIVIIFVFIA